MTTGGSGFYVLTHQGHKLAYLRAIPVSVPPYSPGFIHPADVPLVLPPSQTRAEADLYEVLNVPRWNMLLHRYGPEVVVALQKVLDAGELGLEKITKSPTGATYTLTYDLTGVKILALANSPEVVSIAGQFISQRLRFAPAPIAVMTSATPPPPPRYARASDVVVSTDEELPQIQVARYALRTFNLRHGNLGSLYKGTTWNGGGATAECKNNPPCDHPPSKDPHRCGLYGTLTLDQLFREYGKEAPYCVAVFAAEGKTMLGTRGLRTHAARIVAYWCKSATEKKVFDTQAPQAKHFEKIEELLAAYKFPEYLNADPGLFAPYDPDPPEPHTFPADTDFSSYPPPGVRRPPRRSATVSSTPAAHWAAVAPLMAQATPAGTKIVQDLLGYTPPLAVLCGKCSQPTDALGLCPQCQAGSKV